MRLSALPPLCSPFCLAGSGLLSCGLPRGEQHKSGGSELGVSIGPGCALLGTRRNAQIPGRVTVPRCPFTSEQTFCFQCSLSCERCQPLNLVDVALSTPLLAPEPGLENGAAMALKCLRLLPVNVTLFLNYLHLYVSNFIFPPEAQAQIRSSSLDTCK